MCAPHNGPLLHQCVTTAFTRVDFRTPGGTPPPRPPAAADSVVIGGTDAAAAISRPGSRGLARQPLSSPAAQVDLEADDEVEAGGSDSDVPGGALGSGNLTVVEPLVVRVRPLSSSHWILLADM